MLNSLYAYVGSLFTQLREEGGQTMAEYGILIAVIAIVVIIAAGLLGTNLSSLFNSTATKV
jgi:pilus assembly protein Flp/PilA